jgi:hypothetical protein
MKTGYGNYLLRSKGYRLLSTRARLAEHEEGHSSQCAEIKNEFSFTSNFSICVAGVMQRHNGYVSE